MTLFRWLRLLVLTAVLFCSTTTVDIGYADRGVGVNVGSLQVADRLAPGAGYELPEFAVINTGDEQTTYELHIGYLENQQEHRPDEDWFRFQPQRFSLEPGESRNVVVSIDVSSGAEPGAYFALLRAQTVAEGSIGTQVGVAAATKLSFTVQSASWLDAQRHRVNRWLDDNSPWVFLAPAALLAALLGIQARKLPFRLRVERK